MDYELILDTLTENVKRYRDMIDDMLETPRPRAEWNILGAQRSAYVNVLDEISTLKTYCIKENFDKCEQEIKNILGE